MKHSRSLKGALLGTILTFGLLAQCGGSSSSETLSAGVGTTSFQAGTCNPSSIETAEYLMAFHSCESDCSDPDNHMLQIAKSDDGIEWSLVEEFESEAGSVPDLIFWENYLYMFVPGSILKLDACFQKVAEITFEVESDEFSGMADPSLWVDGDDLIMYYLPTTADGTDPATCSTSPCTKKIRSATPDDDSLENWTEVSGDRISVTLDQGGMSDPDIVQRDDGTYLIFTSSGQNTFSFLGDDLDGTFSPSEVNTDPSNGMTIISDQQGGVPGAIVVDDEIWLYVTTSTNSIESIRRAVSTDGLAELSDEDFETVADGTSFGDTFDATTTISSPSIIEWPTGDWTASE